MIGDYMKGCINKFENGLRLVHKKIDGVHSVAVGIYTAVGSNDEVDENNGISHFIEHMLFKGTKKRDSFQIVKEIDGLGAQVNAFTSKEMTCYYTLSVADCVENCVEILSDLFYNSTFPPQELEKERGVVLEEIAMSEDTPDDLAVENLAKIFFKGHSLGRPILGTAETISKLTSEDLLEYKQKMYTPHNTLICMVGDIDLDTAKSLTCKYFDCESVSEGALNTFDTAHDVKSQSIVINKPLEQANIAIAFPALEFGNPNINALNLFNTIFGGGMSSKLFQQIREELGLAYSVFSYPSAYINNGALTIYVGTNPKTAEKAVKAIYELIKDIKKNGLTEEELERGKKQLRGTYVLGQESTSSQMRIYGRYALFKDICFDFDKMLEDIEKVTLDEINNIIKVIFDFDKVCVSYVGKEIDCDLLNVIKGNR